MNVCWAEDETGQNSHSVTNTTPSNVKIDFSEVNNILEENRPLSLIPVPVLPLPRSDPGIKDCERLKREFIEIRKHENKITLEENDIAPDKLKKLPVPDIQQFLLIKSSTSPIYVFKSQYELTLNAAFDRASAFLESPWGLLDDDHLVAWECKYGMLPNGESLVSFLKEEALTDRGGQDFRCSELAKFFSEAQKNKIALNPIEENMLQFLIQQKVIKKSSSGYSADENCSVIAVSNSSSENSVSHELNHAHYFVDPEYRQKVKELYKNLTKKESDLVNEVMDRAEWGGIYDFRHNEDLKFREFSAYFRDLTELKQSYLEPEGFRSDLCTESEQELLLKSIQSKLLTIEK